MPRASAPHSSLTTSSVMLLGICWLRWSARWFSACLHLELSASSLQLPAMSFKLVFMLMTKQVKLGPHVLLYHWEQPGLKGSTCCCTIQLTSFTGQQTLHMQLHRPFSVLLCLTWSPTSSRAPALASHFKCILFYAKWLGALFRSSIIVIILCPECVEEMLDARPTVQVPSAQNPSCFPFWKIELHKGSCISNLFTVESCYGQLSVQSTSLLPCTLLLCSFLRIAFGKK